jgi:hypothetical protein
MDKLVHLQKAEQDCQQALNTVPGRLILRFLIMLGGIYTPYSKQDLASLPVRGPGEGLAYLEGRRSLALQLIKLGGFTFLKEGEHAD